MSVHDQLLSDLNKTLAQVGAQYHGLPRSWASMGTKLASEGKLTDT